MVGCVVVGGSLEQEQSLQWSLSGTKHFVLDKLSSHDRIYTEILYFAKWGGWKVLSKRWQQIQILFITLKVVITRIH